MTKLQEAVYNAELAAGLPTSELAQTLIGPGEGLIPIHHCAAYLHAIQRLDWFAAAFTACADPLVVIGGAGRSHADAEQWRVKIGAYDRRNLRQCEQACLHELAHVVTADRGPDRELREPSEGSASTKGHHHAWRANYAFIIRMTLGNQAAARLRNEFRHWGLPIR